MSLSLYSSMFYMKEKKYNWEKEPSSDRRRKDDAIYTILSLLKFDFIEFQVGTIVYFKIYVSYIESQHNDSHISATKYSREHGNVLDVHGRELPSPTPFHMPLRLTLCQIYNQYLSNSIAENCKGGAGREKRAPVTGDLEAGEDVIPSLLPVWWGNRHEYSVCGVRQDVRTTLIRGLSSREAQKRDIIPTGIRRGCSMDMATRLPLRGGEDFCRWEEGDQSERKLEEQLSKQ